MNSLTLKRPNLFQNKNNRKATQILLRHSFEMQDIHSKNTGVELK